MKLRLILAALLGLAFLSCASDSTPNTAPATTDRDKFNRATEPLGLDQARSHLGDFLEGPGRLMTIAQCTGCHSGALVRQYRSTRTGWQELIRWMQRKQGLWPLDPTIENEILDYLSTRYGRPADADDRRRPAIAQHLMPPVHKARPEEL